MARNKQDLYQQLVSNIDEYAIFLIDLDGRFGSWNPGVKRILGYLEEEFIGKEAAIIFTPEDRARNAPAMELKQAEAQGRAADDRWHVRKDGSRFWCNGMANALYDDEGQLTGFVKVMRDNTKEKQADEALQDAHDELEQRVEERTRELLEVNERLIASEARFKEIFDAGPFAAVVAAPKDLREERFLNVNQAFSHLSSYEHAEVIGRRCRELGMWSTPEDVKKVQEASDEKGEFRELELTLRTKGGEMRTIRSSAVEIGSDGNRALLKMFYDITDQRRTEEELMKAIDQVMQDTAWFSRSVVERLTYIRRGEPIAEEQVVQLSPREKQVLARMAKGMSDQDIMEELGLSRQTVRNYVTNVYSKINVNSRAQAVVWARERGIVG